MIIEARAALEKDENVNEIKEKISALQEDIKHFSVTNKDGTRKVF